MMGTLATSLARRKIPTPADRYVAQVEGHVEDIEGVLRITRIHVGYELKVAAEKVEEAREVFDNYLVGCPAAMSVQGCIAISHHLEVSEFVSR